MGLCLSGSSEPTERAKGIKIQLGQHMLVLQQNIAHGAYGDVWKCKDVKTNTIYAAKQIKFQTKQLEQMYKKQVTWLQKLAVVPGVVKYIGSKVLDIDNKRNQTSSQIGIIATQFYQISLYDELKNRKLSSYEIINILKQLLRTVKQMHNMGCLHLDLKLQNILCRAQSSGEMSYHICDFGSCMQGPINLQDMDKKQKNKLKQYIEAHSTLIYRAPEMIQLMKVPITSKSDIWMIGCVVYLLLFRKHPFEGQGQLAIVTANVNYNINPQVMDINESGDKNCAKIIKCIKGMLQPKIQDRLDQNKLIQILNE